MKGIVNQSANKLTIVVVVLLNTQFKVRAVFFPLCFVDG